MSNKLTDFNGFSLLINNVTNLLSKIDNKNQKLNNGR